MPSRGIANFERRCLLTAGYWAGNVGSESSIGLTVSAILFVTEINGEVLKRALG